MSKHLSQSVHAFTATTVLRSFISIPVENVMTTLCQPFVLEVNNSRLASFLIALFPMWYCLVFCYPFQQQTRRSLLKRTLFSRQFNATGTRKILGLCLGWKGQWICCVTRGEGERGGEGREGGREGGRDEGGRGGGGREGGREGGRGGREGGREEREGGWGREEGREIEREEGGREGGREGRGGREGGREGRRGEGGREGRVDCYTYSNGITIFK